jgi:annexin A7/11
MHQVKKKFGTDEDAFILILTTRSYSQITAIANAYEKLSKKTLIAALQSELVGDFEKASVSIVEYSKDPSAFWARKLKEAMKGIGTDDEKLIRIMIARAEHDLASIRNVYGDRYGEGRTLRQWIDSDCSGSYQMALQGLLLGNEQ